MRNTDLKILCFLLLLTYQQNSEAQQAKSDILHLQQLKVESRAHPLGIENKLPRFSWQIRSNKRGTIQTAYQILVASSVEKLIEVRGIYGIQEKCTQRNRITFTIKASNCNREINTIGK